MSLLWVLVIAVPVAAALPPATADASPRPRRYAGLTQEHWQEEHERDKVALRRSLEGCSSGPAGRPGTRIRDASGRRPRS